MVRRRVAEKQHFSLVVHELMLILVGVLLRTGAWSIDGDHILVASSSGNLTLVGKYGKAEADKRWSLPEQPELRGARTLATACLCCTTYVTHGRRNAVCGMEHLDSRTFVIAITYTDEMGPVASAVTLDVDDGMVEEHISSLSPPDMDQEIESYQAYLHTIVPWWVPSPRTATACSSTWNVADVLGYLRGFVTQGACGIIGEHQYGCEHLGKG